MTIMPVAAAVSIPYDRLAAFCEKHHITRMWLFGSVLRADFRADSDIGMLVEFDPAHVPGWEIVAMQDGLLQIAYDPESDVLYLSVGEPRRAISREIGDDVLLRIDPETGAVVGLTVMNLSTRSELDSLPVRVDIQAVG